MILRATFALVAFVAAQGCSSPSPAGTPELTVISDKTSIHGQAFHGSDGTLTLYATLCEPGQGRGLYVPEGCSERRAMAGDKVVAQLGGVGRYVDVWEDGQYVLRIPAAEAPERGNVRFVLAREGKAVLTDNVELTAPFEVNAPEQGATYSRKEPLPFRWAAEGTRPDDTVFVTFEACKARTSGTGVRRDATAVTVTMQDYLASQFGEEFDLDVRIYLGGEKSGRSVKRTVRSIR